MDKELLAYLDQRFNETSQQIQELRQETSQQIQELRQETMERFQQVDARFQQVDDQIQQVHVVVEDLRGQIQTVAEGVAAVDGKLERFREAQQRAFDDVRALTRLSYVDLERRVSSLEGRLGELDSRLQVLEAARA